MNQNGKVLRELVKFVKEQRKMNIDLQKANTKQYRMNMYIEKRMGLHYTLLREQREMLHEQREWLKDHEVRLKRIEK